MTKFLLKSSRFILTAAGVYVITCALLSNVTLLQEMPDADLLPHLEQLVSQKKYADAVQLGKDLKRCRQQSNNARLENLLAQAEAGESQIVVRTLKFLRGFLTAASNQAYQHNSCQ